MVNAVEPHPERRARGTLRPSQGVTTALRYEPRPEYEDEFGSPQRIAQLTGRNKDVLDVGCGSGSVAQRLVANGCRVTGIEKDAESAAKARRFCDDVLQLDLDQIDSLQINRRFDVIVCGDVLEHLRDPPRVLLRLLNFLKADGHLVLSVPNVAHVSIRLKPLMSGAAVYRKGRHPEASGRDERHVGAAYRPAAAVAISISMPMR